MFTILVHFTIKPNHIADFRKAMIENADTSLKQEPACQVFDVCWDPADDTKACLYEVYDDKAAFDFHLSSPHFKSFNETVTPWVANKHVSTWQKAYPEKH